MTNRTKILIGILIIIAITVGIVGAINKNKNNETLKNNKSKIDQMVEYIEKTQNKSEENIVIENNEIENNTIENSNIEYKEDKKENTIGKEEQESKDENTQLKDEEKAIQMAKEEWAISIESYDFQAKLKKEGIYEVTVISNDSNRTTVAIYTVNVKEGTVTE